MANILFIFCPLCGRKTLPYTAYGQPSQCKCGYVCRIVPTAFNKGELAADNPKIKLYKDYTGIGNVPIDSPIVVMRKEIVKALLEHFDDTSAEYDNLIKKFLDGEYVW